ncbi:MAG: hypothetical protein IT388_01300 [Nitrospirales bacterium]|nr:hypothetical protein [Nitrospirales bacterium]
MTEGELFAHLRSHYPCENESCEWKEFKQLRHTVSGSTGDIGKFDSASRKDLENPILDKLSDILVHCHV